MNTKIFLSYTTLSNYHEASHTYINKLMGIKVPETEAMIKGRETHEKLQQHMLGVKKLPIDLTWNITKAEVHVRKPIEGEFVWHGFLDGVNYKSKVAIEIKTGTPWSQQKFHNSIQPKYYSWVSGFRKFLFITCRFDLSDLKTYYTEMTDKDWEEAEKWATEALKGIKAGEFKGGLDENDVCLGCNYGPNCYFAP